MISALRRGHEGMTEKTTHVVGEGADAITYDVRGDLASATPERPVLMLIGSPMDASGFGTLAGHFTDRPGRHLRPPRRGPQPDRHRRPMTTPEQHADDLHRVIQALGAGPVDLFATSGGAVNALALVGTAPRRRTPPGGARAADRRVAARPRAGRWRRARTSATTYRTRRASARRWPSSSRW